MRMQIDTDPTQPMDRIGYYLKQIDANNALLLKISQKGLDVFIEDELVFNAGCFLLQRSIAGCINLGIHIITTHDFQTPESYDAIFDTLASREVIPLQLADRLKGLVAIRSQLVNLDPELDTLTVFNAIRHELVSILAFEKHILNWLRPAI
ncbi:MAG: DUF86 domain-containing protein [Candidatus Coatesbacteria bacterium]|nr:DUF86 domain-containing protein [Candidatus Coatesbacteria bacterium]